MGKILPKFLLQFCKILGGPKQGFLKPTGFLTSVQDHKALYMLAYAHSAVF